MVPSFSYLRARDVKEAVAHLGGEGARVHAGGTDLLGCLRDGVFTARTVVSLSGIGSLAGIAGDGNGGLRIGSLATVASAAASDLVARDFPALAQAAASVASPQLRNQGTMGGNLCQKPRCWYYRGDFNCLRKGGGLCFAVDGRNAWHCVIGGDGCHIVHPSDTAPALAAYGARVTIEGPGGARTVPVESFHVPPSEDPTRETVLERDEIVTEIEVPAPPPGCRSSYRKVRSRGAWDFAVAGVALAVCIEGGRVTRARIVLSGAAPVPWRAKAAEESLVGGALTSTAAERAGRAAMEGAAPLSENAYKVRLFEGLVAAELQKLA